MTLKEIADQWVGKTVPYPEPDTDKLQGQCVQFIRWLLLEYYKKPQWSKRLRAAELWTLYEIDPVMNQKFVKIPNTPEFVPQEGDICIWNKAKGGGYGHIAVVYGDKQNVKTMTCLEQNWKPLTVSIQEHDYKDVLGFLRPKESV
jgi:hypothetical protein